MLDNLINTKPLHKLFTLPCLLTYNMAAQLPFYAFFKSINFVYTMAAYYYACYLKLPMVIQTY